MPVHRRVLNEVTKRKFFVLIRPLPDGAGLSPARAAEELGFSKATAYRLMSDSSQSVAGDRRAASTDLPNPRSLEELSTDARDALADINLFGEMFFCRRPAPWRYDAAMRIVDAIQDRTQRSFIDMNVFPGAGKTTLLHDVECWLVSGGGFSDPTRGRAIRIMVGSRVAKVSEHSLLRVRRSLELRRAFYDKEQQREAQFVLAREYGRFKPDTMLGDESSWSRKEVLVAQLADIDLYEKEPTIQIASQESGFLGERVDLALWDDLATYDNSRNPVMADELANWFEDEAETRVEPGGVLALVGQRLSPIDLHRNRLDAVVREEDGTERKKYKHIVYPAHQDAICDADQTEGSHRQWDPEADAGCLTDIARLPLKDWVDVRAKMNYRTVYQQEDSDPARILVQPVWLEGGTDSEGYPAPGCYDRDRGFLEWPQGVGATIDYCVLDPSAGNFWAQEWWAIQPESRHNYLISARRGKIQAGKFLDWDNHRQEFTGWMHETQTLSYKLGHPIRVWIIEAVAAHKYLFQFEHFRRWRAQFPYVHVEAHQTQRNKNDEELGVEGLMPGRYRTGMKHLPKKQGFEALNYLRVKEKELTSYPFGSTDDTVMADWMGEWNLDKIITWGRRKESEEVVIDPDLRLPRYLKRQRTDTSMSV